MLQYPSITQIGRVHEALTEGLSEKGGRLAWAISATQFYVRGRTRKSAAHNGDRGLMPKPKLINMHGRKGIVPAGALYIGRQMPWLGLPRSRWANPFKIGRDGSRAEVIGKYRDYLLSRPELMAALPELRGTDLACWCSPEPCHGEVLLELANS